MAEGGEADEQIQAVPEQVHDTGSHLGLWDNGQDRLRAAFKTIDYGELNVLDPRLH